MIGLGDATETQRIAINIRIITEKVSNIERQRRILVRRQGIITSNRAVVGAFNRDSARGRRCATLAVRDFIGERHLRRLADAEVLITGTRIKAVRTVCVNGQTRHRITRLGVAQVVAIDIRGIKLTGNRATVFGGRHRFITGNRAIIGAFDRDRARGRRCAALPVRDDIGERHLCRFTNAEVLITHARIKAVGTVCVNGQPGNAIINQCKAQVITVNVCSIQLTSDSAPILGRRNDFVRSNRAIIGSCYCNSCCCLAGRAIFVLNGIGDHDILGLVDAKSIESVARREGNCAVCIDNNRTVNAIGHRRARYAKGIAVQIRIVRQNINGNGRLFTCCCRVGCCNRAIIGPGNRNSHR